MAKKKIHRKKEEENKVAKYGAIFLMVLMILSIAGFALMSGGGSSSNNNRDVPFQEFQDPNSGQIFWGARKGDEEFIFLNITDFDKEENLANIALEIKDFKKINIYVSPKISDKSVEYMLKKVLKAYKIKYNQIFNYNCDKPTLAVVSQNETLNKKCYNIITKDNNNAYFKIEAFTYHMLNSN